MNRHWEAIMEGDQGRDLWGAEELEAEPMDLEESGTTMADESRGLGGVLDFIRENPIGVTINPASLCPPVLAAGGGSSSCSWALLDLKAYIADRPNATTAKDFTRAGHEIQATLCLARPPCVSHLCVHCPALSPADFGTEPAILASCDGFIFFKAGICNASVCFEPALQDFFVYRAPLSRLEGRPSLTRLPHPGPSCNITASMVGLVCCGDEEAEDSSDDYSGGGCTLRPHAIPQQQYVIAGLQSSKGSTQFKLHRFDSREGKWTTEVLQLGPMEPSPGLTFFFHGTHKVITLGGGFMGWVDLCRGILFCNVLVDHPELHYIPLPESADASKGMPEAAANEFRDVSVVQGYIKYVEHQTEFQPESCGNGTYISDDWTVTTWTRKFTLNCRQGHWRRKFKCDASKMSGSLPKLLGFEETTPLPPLCRLHTGHPMLGLDEDVVYVLAKVDHRDDKAFVLAINMKDGMLQAADHFGAERTMGISFTYTQYKTSDSFNIAPGKKEKQKKRPGLLLGSLSNKKPGLRCYKELGLVLLTGFRRW